MGVWGRAGGICNAEDLTAHWFLGRTGAEEITGGHHLPPHVLQMRWDGSKHQSELRRAPGGGRDILTPDPRPGVEGKGEGGVHSVPSY